MIKIVVFDLDGTLVNSLTDLAQSVNKGLVKAGIKAEPIENYNQYVGNGREVMITKAMESFRITKSFLRLLRTRLTANTQFTATTTQPHTTAVHRCLTVLNKGE